MADDSKEEVSDLYVDPLGGMGLDNAEAVPALEESGSPISLDGELLAPAEDNAHGSAHVEMPFEAADNLGELDSVDLPTAVESATANLDSMLEAALPEENSAAPTPDPSADSSFNASPPPTLAGSVSPGDPQDPLCRFYSVEVRGLKAPGAVDAVLSVLERFPQSSADDSAPKRLRESGGYRWTHLGEFQAYALMLHFYKMGLECRLSFHDEEGFAADLSEAGFPLDEIKSTGAQPVPLPSKADEVLLSTSDAVPGYGNGAPKGIVTAHGSIGRVFFRQDETESRLKVKINELWPQPSGMKPKGPLPRAEIDKVFQNLLLSLQREAFRRGGNAVVSIRISGFAEAESLNPDADQIRLIATGTAILLNVE